MQKISLFHHFVPEIYLTKNPVICLAKSILAHMSGAKHFPNTGFVQEYSK